MIHNNRSVSEIFCYWLRFSRKNTDFLLVASLSPSRRLICQSVSDILCFWGKLLSKIDEKIWEKKTSFDSNISYFFHFSAGYEYKSLKGPDLHKVMIYMDFIDSLLQNTKFININACKNLKISYEFYALHRKKLKKSRIIVYFGVSTKIKDFLSNFKKAPSLNLIQ